MDNVAPVPLGIKSVLVVSLSTIVSSLVIFDHFKPSDGPGRPLIYFKVRYSDCSVRSVVKNELPVELIASYRSKVSL